MMREFHPWRYAGRLVASSLMMARQKARGHLQQGGGVAAFEDVS